jgi:ribosomal protein S18 acetylase RimI-like enzyme
MRWLAAPRAAALVARSSGRLAGYAVVRVVEAAGSWRWGDEVGVLETLVVGSDDRGAGVGQALLEAARSRLAGWGIRVMTVSVMAGNEGALRFYRRVDAADYLQTLIMPVEGNRPG